jgi:plastocyanin
MKTYKKTIIGTSAIFVALMVLSGCGANEGSAPDHGLDSEDHHHDGDKAETHDTSMATESGDDMIDEDAMGYKIMGPNMVGHEVVEAEMMDDDSLDLDSMDHHSTTSTPEMPEDARKVTVVTTDYAFDPATITARPGEKLYIELVNEGNAVHMWQLEGKPETHIHTAVGETSTNVVTAPQKTGTYKIVCGTSGHEDLGMVGTLKVE